jgi:hypothetical protein
MVEFIGKITYKGDNNVLLYKDSSMEDDKFLKGRKGYVQHNNFMIASPKTANIIYQLFLKEIRKRKIKNINENC